MTVIFVTRKPGNDFREPAVIQTDAMPDEIDVTCPYCGESGTVTLDESEEEAEFVQDCAVCCRPWQVRIRVGRDGSPEVTVSGEGE